MEETTVSDTHTVACNARCYFTSVCTACVVERNRSGTHILVILHLQHCQAQNTNSLRPLVPK